MQKKYQQTDSKDNRDANRININNGNEKSMFCADQMNMQNYKFNIHKHSIYQVLLN